MKRRKRIVRGFGRINHALLALALSAMVAYGFAGLPNLVASAQPQEQPPIPGGPLAATARNQIAALLADKRARTPAQRKIDSNLLWRIKQLRSEPITAQLPSLRADVQPALGGLVEVDIQADIDDALLAQIRALGGTVESAFPQYRAVRARIPLVQAERLAELAGVHFIQPKQLAVTAGMPAPAPGFDARAALVRSKLTEVLGIPAARQPLQGGPIANKVNTSEGDKTHRADLARSTFGVS
ncbi:MAG TPA: hypothetical protein PKK15_20065, partial [Kouleothrix sp.]|nr:hypothetical protein [Kouleothrix sp.]